MMKIITIPVLLVKVNTSMMTTLYINNTGIREGERIIGVGKQCRGSVMRLVRGFYPPCPLVNDELIVRDRFTSYPFYSSMILEDRIQYIMNAGTNNKDLYMDDVDMVVKFEVLSGEYFSQYPDICSKLIGMGDVSIIDAFNMFPTKIGSRARKHTLVFRPTNWSLQVEEEKKYNYVVDVMNGVVTNEKPRYVINDIGYKVINGSNLNPRGRVILDEMKDYSPSFLKSIIQKIIRTKCSTVRFPTGTYPSLTVLHSAITALLTHPGSFVPNIQRFVKGSESCFKRLAVTIAEDSHVDNSYYIYALLVTALLLQREQDYIPDDSTIELLYITSELALKSDKCYMKHGSHQYPTDIYWFNDASNILRLIGSFETDIRMLTEYTGCSMMGDVVNPLDTMPIWHAIDHHCYTDVGWFCDMNSHKDYSSLFHDMWDKSSSYNPRRGITYYDIYSKAQEECYMFHHSITHPIENLQPMIFNYTLSKDYIHSIIGTLYYKNYVIVRLGEGIARRPRRDDPNHVKVPIGDVERQDVMNYIRQQLGTGISRELVPGVNIIIHGLDYIMCCGMKYTWDQLRSFQWTRYEREGINDVIDEMRCCTRLKMYISSCWGNRIELHRIGRDGTGTKYAVHRDDSKAFMLLKKFSSYTSCITISDGSIIINDRVSFWYYRDLICGTITTVRSSNWYYNPDCDKRVMYEYQSMSLDKLTQRDKNILWIDVGMGKTLIVLQYIKYLIDNSLMNTYCCYALPPSALNSIMNECQLAGIGYNVIDMRKGQVNCYLIPNTINLIYHDHLRLGNMADQLRYYADDLLFIVDEFHLCLSNTTIRTSLSVEIAKLSSRFVALSGTILNNVDAIDDLIEWLEMTSSYPITKNNYQVAVDSIVSEFTTKPVNVIRTERYVPMTDEQQDLYKSLVPQSLGGTYKDLKFHEAINVCYTTVLANIAEYAKSIVSYGPIVIVVNDINQQEEMKKMLDGFKVHLIGIGNSITLTPQDTTDLQFIITTIKYNAGYTLTKSYIMLTSVYPSNEASRVQIEGRLVRVGQTKDVHIITFHTGIMSYMLERYKKTANLNQILKELTN